MIDVFEVSALSGLEKTWNTFLFTGEIMNISSLIPVPDFIPLDWPWFQFFLILTFFLHLLAMNLMLGSAVIAAAERFKRHDKARDLNLDKPIAKRLPFIIAFAVNLGVAPLLFLQVLYGHFMYTSSILMAVYWLSVIGLVILAYYGAYIYAYRKTEDGKTFIITAIALLLLVIGFLFTCNMTLMITPEKWPACFTHAHGRFLPLKDPVLIPRYLHFVLSALAVAGLFHAALKVWKKKTDHTDTSLGNNGIKWFFHATLLQIPVGIWFLAALPRPVMLWFMGGSVYATILFAAGMVCSLVCLVFGFQKKIKPAVFTLIPTVMIMVLIRDEMRTAYLNKYFILDDLVVKPAFSPLIFFSACLIFGAVMVVYMIKLAICAVQEDKK